MSYLLEKITFPALSIPWLPVALNLGLGSPELPPWLSKTDLNKDYATLKNNRQNNCNAMQCSYNTQEALGAFLWLHTRGHQTSTKELHVLFKTFC